MQLVCIGDCLGPWIWLGVKDHKHLSFSDSSSSIYEVAGLGETSPSKVETYL